MGDSRSSHFLNNPLSSFHVPLLRTGKQSQRNDSSTKDRTARKWENLYPDPALSDCVVPSPFSSPGKGGGPDSDFWPAALELLSELTLGLAWTSFDEWIRPQLL